VEKNCSLETLFQDDRITDEEWIALGKALDIKNILEKNIDERLKLFNDIFRLFLSNRNVEDYYFKYSSKKHSKKSLFVPFVKQKEFESYPKFFYSTISKIYSKNSSENKPKPNVNYEDKIEDKIFKWILFNDDKYNDKFNDVNIYQIEQDVYDFVLKKSKNKFGMVSDKNFFESLMRIGLYVADIFKNNDEYFKLKELVNNPLNFFPVTKLFLDKDCKKLIHNFTPNTKLLYDKDWENAIPLILIVSVIRKRLLILDFFKEIDDGKIDNNI